MSTSTRIRHAAVGRICLAIALVLVLSSGVVSAARLQGRIKHDVYASPAKNFRVPVPQGLGMSVSDGYSKDDTSEIGAVSFHDDFGSLSAIHYMCVGPNAVEQLQQADLSVIAKWLPQVAMPTWFLNASPDSRIVHQENGTFENMSVSVAQVEIPGGSPLVTLDASGKSTRMDSLRGLVIFQRGRWETQNSLRPIRWAPTSAHLELALCVAALSGGTA